MGSQTQERFLHICLLRAATKGCIPKLLPKNMWFIWQLQIIQFSISQNIKNTVNVHQLPTASWFFIPISIECCGILAFLVFWILASNYSGLLYKRGIMGFGIQLLCFCFRGSCIIKPKVMQNLTIVPWWGSLQACGGEIAVVPQHYLWIREGCRHKAAVAVVLTGKRTGCKYAWLINQHVQTFIHITFTLI